jgi:hypothetical protein
MQTLLYYILISLLPLLANLAGYIVSLWSAYELESINHYLDTGIRIVFIFILGYVLSSIGFIGFLILMIFILYSLSNYFWKFEPINMFVFAILIVLTPNTFILVLIFIYFLISTTLSYNKVHKDKTIKFSMYPIHAIHFMKKYWIYYMFILVTLIIVLFLFAMW